MKHIFIFTIFSEKLEFYLSFGLASNLLIASNSYENHGYQRCQIPVCIRSIFIFRENRFLIMIASFYIYFGIRICYRHIWIISALGEGTGIWGHVCRF